MSVTITDEILDSAGLSETEFMQEVAVMLFQQETISLGKASAMANMNQLQFLQLLGSRSIPIHYDINELQEDLKTLEVLGWT